MSKLSEVQQALSVPKNRTNAYNPQNKYKFRSGEDIIAGLKKVMGDGELILSDEAVELCGRVYIKSTATFTSGDKSWSATAFAKETVSRKGMDDPQLTGCASSYSRKFAMQALLLLDNEADPDSLAPPPQDDGGPADWTPPPGHGRKPATEPTPWDGQREPPPSDPPSSDMYMPDTEPAPPATAPQGQIPAPTPEQRKWLGMLWDYYVGQSQGRIQAKDSKKTQKLCHLCQLHMHRYPGSMSDVEQLKAWIKVEELCV